MNYIKYVRLQIRNAVREIRKSYALYQTTAHENPDLFALSSGRIIVKKISIDEIYGHFTYIRGMLHALLISNNLTPHEYEILWEYTNRVQEKMCDNYCYNFN